MVFGPISRIPGTIIIAILSISVLGTIPDQTALHKIWKVNSALGKVYIITKIFVRVL
jgi:hypothetical protein